MVDALKIDVDTTGFSQFLKEALNVVSDLTIPLALIGRDFYKSQPSVFRLKSFGAFAPLKPSTIAQKERKFGLSGGKPILVASGALRDSLSSGGGRGAIFDISGGKTLDIGTKIPYAQFLQEGTSKMPARPFLFIDRPPGGVGTSLFIGREKRWRNIVNDHIVQVFRRRGWSG